MSDSDSSARSNPSGPATTNGSPTEQTENDVSSEDEETPREDAADDEAQDTGDNSDGVAHPLSTFLENVQTALDEDRPAGERILYDQNFQTLKSEIDKIGSASGDADYEEIVELARSLLTNKAKDLRAAAYLVIAEARLNGTAGVAEGVHAVRLLIDNFWNDLFPEKSRMKGRGSALQFIADRLPDWLNAASFEQKDREHLERALKHLTSIQEFSLQEMGEHAPSFSGLISDLKGEISALPDPDPEPDVDGERGPDPPYEGSASEKEQTTSAERQATDGGVPDEVASGADALQSIRRAAGYYRENDTSDPVSYRLLRTVRWSTLRSEPSNDGGSTRFEAPREQRRTYLEGLLEDDEYETLVREGESSFQSGTFHVWLDLQRLVVAALDALGASYRDARDAVLLELGQLVQRVPSILSLTYADGTPLANPLTVDWIETEVLSRIGGEEARSQESGGEEGFGAVREDYEQARSALSGGDIEGALSVMSEGALSDGSKKEEFHRQLYVARLCLTAGQPRVARPLLDELDVAIEEHALDAWDPSLALKVWTIRCECYDLLVTDAGPDESESLRSEAEASFEKICRTDPEHAVSVESRRVI